MHILYTLDNNHICLMFSWVPADKPARLKNSMANCIILKFQAHFCMTFVLAIGWPTYHIMPLYTVVY